MTRVAAVDCGTNSTRLLVADVVDGATVWRDRDAITTRLGQGVDHDGRLHPGAIARTAEVVGGYAARWRALGCARVAVVATSAVRDVADRAAFHEAIEDVSGVRPEVLDGYEEAALAFEGAVTGVDPARPALVLDIGGGSTELILGHDRPQACESRQIGSVRLTERLLPGDPPSQGALAAAARVIDGELADVAHRLDPSLARSLVAVAGTATTLAALHLGLAAYDPHAIHAAVLSRGAVARLLAELGGSTAARIAGLGPVAPGREDVLTAGALILERVMAWGGFEEVVVSERDLLDGLCRALAAAG